MFPEKFLLPLTKEHIEKALFVFALDVEAADEFAGVNKIITGCGKINAAYELTRALQQAKPPLIINLGSAGSNSFLRGQVVCCTAYLQRDMNAIALGFNAFETPFAGTPALLQYGLAIEGLPQGICGTGDSFETNGAATSYQVIDMEAYALAHVAQKEKIPFLCLKYISDGADGAAADDWRVRVHDAATAFRNILFATEKNE